WRKDHRPAESLPGFTICSTCSSALPMESNMMIDLLACPTQAIGRKVCQSKAVLVNPIYMIRVFKKRYCPSLISIHRLVGSVGPHHAIFHRQHVVITAISCPRVEIEVRSCRATICCKIVKCECYVGAANLWRMFYLYKVRALARADDSSFSITLHQHG